MKAIPRDQQLVKNLKIMADLLYSAKKLGKPRLTDTERKRRFIHRSLFSNTILAKQHQSLIFCFLFLFPFGGVYDSVHKVSYVFHILK